jgi:hypothetical protein
MTRSAPYTGSIPSGQVHARTNHKRENLVVQGKASRWMPYRNVDDALEAAGLI